MINPIALQRDIVMLGGGHSHALVLRRWAMKPLAGVRLTLISQDVLTPYSGMLPGYIAGHYSSDDIHIDLSRLCRWAGVRFIEATATGLDLAQQQIQLTDRPSVAYDVLSIDTGSTPEIKNIPGASEHTIPVKPINQLDSRWQAFRERLAEQKSPLDIAVVGSGVGGFELLVALQHDLKSRARQFRMHWILRGDKPLKSRPEKVAQLALQTCQQKGIEVHTGFDVTKVTAEGLASADERFLALDEIFWCTAAAAPEWPGAAGLQTDQRGFVATNAYLQSYSHQNVFASGDVATQIDTPSEKAGVFAVRQAPVLFENLRRFIAQQPLKVYRPQKETLSLMALGEKRAIATRGSFTLSGDWVWRWKDHIDKAFMRKLKDLPRMTMPALTHHMMPDVLQQEANIDPQLNAAPMRCGGCGAKVPADILARVMQRLETVRRSDVLVGISPPRDAAVIDDVGQPMAQSVDQFRAMLDDPYVFGRVSALHALSDIFALSAEPQSALAIVTLPHAADALLERELFQLMSGALYELNRHQCALTGGHSSEGAELSFGFVVNGWLESELLPFNSAPRAGDYLILSKALGTGVLLNADMQAKAGGVQMRTCIQSMLLSNAPAVPLLSPFRTAQTDITGFGLLGHLISMLENSHQQTAAREQLCCEIVLDDLPILPGATELAVAGVQSTLLPANLRFLQRTDHPDSLPQWQAALLCDPQTSGGLLASVPAKYAEQCLTALQQAGYGDAAIIGRVQTSADSAAPLVRFINSV